MTFSQHIKTAVFFTFLLFGVMRVQAEEMKYLWPMTIDPALTSSFGEYRSGHFHSGIDVKVWGQMDLPCVAVADGWVSRVKVSPSGYGKALYLTLADGRQAVYAHLERFAPEVEEFVQKLQHQNVDFDLDYYFTEPQAFHFKRGEVVAHQGRSGTRHPHLHFEIRDPLERPMNPLNFGFTKTDKVPPTPSAVAIIPLDGKSTVEKDWQPRIYSLPVQEQDGVYRPRDPIGITGRVGISVKAFDRANGSENFLGIYKIEMKVNGELRWTTQFDRFDFNETGQIVLERDYRLQKLGLGIYYRLYRVTGNTLDLISGDGEIIGGGQSTEPLNVEIEISDVNGNVSKIEIVLVSDQFEDENRGVTGAPSLKYQDVYDYSKESLRIKQYDRYFRVFGPPGLRGFKINGEWNYIYLAQPVEGGVAASWTPPRQFTGPLHLESSDVKGNVQAKEILTLYPVYPDRINEIDGLGGAVKVVVPKHAVYDTTWIQFQPDSVMEISGWVESVFRIEPRDQPLRNDVIVYVNCEAAKVEEGWGIYYCDDKRGWKFLSNEMKDGKFVATSDAWERFGLVRDVDVPVLKERKNIDGITFNTKRPLFQFQLLDTTSGIDYHSIKFNIDGVGKPAYYDPLVDRLSYKVWQPLTSGSHTLEIEVADKVGNSTRKSLVFNIQ